MFSQTEVNIALILCALGFWFFFKPKSTAVSGDVAQAGTEEQQKNAVPQTGKGGFNGWMKRILKIQEEDEEKAVYHMKWRLLILIFVITICIAYILPDNAAMFTKLGVIVVAVLHAVGLWLLVVEQKVTTAIKVMVLGYFSIIIVGLFLPEPMYQLWQDIKATQKEMNRPGLFKDAFKSPPATETEQPQPKAKGRWMKFDSDVYTLANNDPEGIIVDNPEEWVPLPRIPTGYRFNVYCDDAALKIYWKGGPQYGKELKCGEKFGENLEDLLVTVSPNTETRTTVSVWIEPLH